jgi:hypothetical protein
MNRIAKQAILAVVFVGLLGFVAYQGGGGQLAEWWRRITGKDEPTETFDPEKALRNYQFFLEECAKKSGIDFTHESPVLDAKLEHIMPLVAAMNASVSLIDFDGDGLLDIYVVTSKEGGRNRLYRNKGDGTFEDVAEAMGVADLNQPGTGVCTGAIWADYDNDGHPDLLVYKWGKPELFHNKGGLKGFERVTDGSGLPAWVNANSACWLDFDGDGLPDLFIAGYWRDDIDLFHLNDTKMMPESFEFANNGGRKYLLRNKGNGKFEDVTEQMGIKSTRWTLAVAAADLCGTGYPDLILANDYGVSEFYANQKGKGFREVGQESGIGVKPKSGMNVSFGDVYNKGQLAIHVSNISDPGNLVQGNSLWVPVGQTPSGAPLYHNQAGTLNIERGGWSWGAKFGDLNNDGWLDLYLVNGYVSANRSKSYWYDYGKIAGGLNQLISDARFWPDMRDQSEGRPVHWGYWAAAAVGLVVAVVLFALGRRRSQWWTAAGAFALLVGLGSLAAGWYAWHRVPAAERYQSLAGYQRKCLWLNKQGGGFVEIAPAVGVTDTYDGRAVALGDLFNRGVLDVVVANQNGPLLLYKNTVAPGRDWVQFQLTGGARAGREGRWSNRSAIGAKVQLSWRQGDDGPLREQVQVVTAGDGYASQSMLRLHFGLGENASIEKAVIIWPSGRRQTLEKPKVGIIHNVPEE